MHIYEFEIYETEGAFLAFPYDLPGGTQGSSFKEACEMAADWLQTSAEHWAMHGGTPPEPTFGNEPQNGGKTVIVAVSASKETVRKVSPSAAARMLGVTPGRVTQMMNSGKLESFELDGRRWVTVASVRARLAEAPTAGRPKKPVTA